MGAERRREGEPGEGKTSEKNLKKGREREEKGATNFVGVTGEQTTGG